MWCIIYTTEYYSAIKKTGILSFVTTWVNLKGIMLREVGQTEKDKYCITFMWNIKKESLNSESRRVVARGWGVGKWERLVRGYKLVIIRGRSSEDLMYRPVTVLHNAVL